ncbi:16656_t:CDS:1 [Cetraspora pellucida]|uniref:16656_t:CDS:1 n=1 Tax=Cetraspora pellucida TaxID=1433469 RepID=A0ACA9KNT5_9GLOM|nr:16656_t:CDS:1 [Cetraspora pellucida]
MGSKLSHCTCSDLGETNESNEITLSRQVVSLVPEFNSEDIYINSYTATYVSTLLQSAEYKLHTHEYTKSITFLQRATQLGSAMAAARLGSIYSQGLNATIAQDFATSAAYYFLALKLIMMIPSTSYSWDLLLVLEIVIGLTDLYRQKLNHRSETDIDIINCGVKIMRNIDDKLRNPFFIRVLDYNDTQLQRAIRIHVNFCFATASMHAGEIFESRMSFREVEAIGDCGHENADRLVVKARDYIQLLDSKIPKFIECACCKYAPTNLKDIEALKECSNCRTAAFCKDCISIHTSSCSETLKIS